MANTLRIKRRAAGGAAGAPASLAAAELAYNEQDNILYYGKGDVGGVASTVVAIAGSGAYSGTSHTHILDTLSTPLSNVSFGNVKITNLGAPTASTDAATRGYVDSVAQGLSPKASVRVATVAAGTLASSFANGSIIDGVTLATDNRILIKNQAASAENGIYTVNASGAPTRATDANAWSELPGAYFFVQEGTTNAEMGSVCTSNTGGTLGSTAITFQQFSGAGQITANGGLTKSGNTISIAFDTTVPLVAGTAAAGTATVAAHRDHVHPAQTTVSGNAGTVTNATFTTALTVNTGTVTLKGNAANTSALTLGAGASTVSGTNTGDNATNTNYASDYRAANFIAGTNYVAPGGALGTPASGTLTNCTFPTLNQSTTGTASGLTNTITSNSITAVNTLVGYNDGVGFSAGFDIKTTGYTSTSLRFISNTGAVFGRLRLGASFAQFLGSTGYVDTELSAGKFTSGVSTGTAPISTSSTTVCANLNADMVDGVHLSGLLQTSSTIDGGTF